MSIKSNKIYDEEDRYIVFRPGEVGDGHEIASYISLAGDGLYEFLLDDLVPALEATDILRWAIASSETPLSYRNCFVAVDTNSRQLAGVVNSFPADLLREHGLGFLPSARTQHVRAILDLQDWGSWFINGLAVGERWRRKGIATQLLEHAASQAREAGFDRISLHVWADNLSACAFYKKIGFVALGTADITTSPRLPHTKGSILMRLEI